MENSEWCSVLAQKVLSSLAKLYDFQALGKMQTPFHSLEREHLFSLTTKTHYIKYVWS